MRRTFHVAASLGLESRREKDRKTIRKLLAECRRNSARIERSYMIPHALWKTFILAMGMEHSSPWPKLCVG